MGRLLFAALESGTAGQIAEQNLPFGFELRTDESQPQEKTAEGVFFVLYRFFFGGYPLLAFCQVA